MPRFIQKEVDQMADDPEEGAMAVLLVGVSESRDQVIQLVDELGGELLEELPFDTLRITIPEEKFHEVRDNDAIDTMEFDEEGRIQGNFRFLQV